MTIEATYAANEYMVDTLDGVSLSCGEIYPGQFAPSIEDRTKFVTYLVVPNDIYDLAGLKQDFITYRFYNPDFDELHRINQIVKDTFNVYNIQETSLAETNITFKESFYRTISSSEASFAEGVDYFVIVGELTIQYTEES